MTETMHPRLIIDLGQCDQCESCGVRCGYHARPQAGAHGMYLLRERVTFAVVCRRCRLASCIEACPFDALERSEDGLIQRHNLRCVACKSCAVACPFGTIYPEWLTFYETRCDACLDTDTPACVASCSRGALEFRAVGPDEAGLHIVDDRLAVRAERWTRREVAA